MKEVYKRGLHFTSLCGTIRCTQKEVHSLRFSVNRSKTETKGNEMTVTLHDGEKITATMTMLNHLACVYYSDANGAERMGHNDYAEIQRRYANEIHDALAEVGFYNGNV